MATTGCCFLGVLERKDRITARESMCIHVSFKKVVGKLLYAELLSK